MIAEELGGNLLAAMEKYAAQIEKSENDPEIIEASRIYNELNGFMLDALDVLVKLQLQYKPKMDELEEYIKAQVLELGLSANHVGVEAKHRKGYDRITWNNKKLTELCMENPAVLSMIKSTRQVTPVEPSVKISYSTPEVEEIETPEVEAIETPSEETPF